MKNKLYIEKLSDELTKNKWTNELDEENNQLCIRVETGIDPDGCAIVVGICVVEKHLQFILSPLLEINGAYQEKEEKEDEVNCLLIKAYHKAANIVSGRTNGLNNLQYVIDHGTIYASFEVFIPGKIKNCFYASAVEHLLYVNNKINETMPEIIELGEKIFDNKKQKFLKKKIKKLEQGKLCEAK